ncbi:MAG: C45 family autoproteolytic acyltransferase/hydrolase [Planctomycetaceae bacterium]
MSCLASRMPPSATRLPRRILMLAVSLGALLSVAAGELSAQTIARCGAGWLEKIDGYLVVHVKGTPYEMGYQQGALLKDHIRQSLDTLLNVKGDVTLVEYAGFKVKPRFLIETIIEIQKPYVPKKYFEEMDGLAAGSGVSLKDVRMGNFLPELFHCSGFAVMNSATKDGTLYHGRVLDYACDWGLQDHAVIVVAEPDGEIPFVNVTYTGFIGCVTGMNAEHISVGEMGGRGQGHWNGVPMSFLVREVLQTSRDFETAISVFRDNPRTCQYFYVVSDGETRQAAGMEASWNVFRMIKPGQMHPLLPTPVADAALLSAGDRYRELVRRVKEQHGELTAESALRLMDRPVAMKSNLHNVLFEPMSTKFWVANASADGKPAAEQKYFEFQLSELLDRKPDTSSPEIPLIVETAAKE